MLASADYSNAKIEYEKATNLKPEEKYPRQKLQELTAKLNELKQIQERYNGLIALADKDFAAQKYESAIQSYTEASNLKQNETYPRGKINEINTLLGQLKAQDEQYNQFIASAFSYSIFASLYCFVL